MEYGVEPNQNIDETLKPKPKCVFTYPLMGGLLRDIV